MSGSDLFTHVFRSTPGSPPHRSQNQTRRRKRPQLSCTQCKTRKLKCGRGPPPCSTCVRRGLEASCTFATLNATMAVQNPSADRTSRSVEQLRRLEDIVLEMSDHKATPRVVCASPHFLDVAVAENKHKTNSQSFNAPNASNQTKITPTPKNGVLKDYVGATHWSAVMENVRLATSCCGLG